MYNLISIDYPDAVHFCFNPVEQQATGLIRKSAQKCVSSHLPKIELGIADVIDLKIIIYGRAVCCSELLVLLRG